MDIAYKDLKTNEVFSDVIDIGNSPKYLKLSTKMNKIEKIKDEIAKGKLKLKTIDIKKTFKKNSVQLMSSSEEDKIMDVLYDEGWPEAYSNYLRDSKTYNGAYAELRHNLSYNIRERDSITIAAGATLSVIVLYYTWPSQLWAQISSVALTGKGVYEAIKSFVISDYDVLSYGNKYVYVEDEYQYQADRTVKWRAIVADLGATLDFQYDNHHHDYFDNEGLLDTGLDNYFN